MSCDMNFTDHLMLREFLQNTYSGRKTSKKMTAQSMAVTMKQEEKEKSFDAKK